MVFGARCRLKKIVLTSGRHAVLTRNALKDRMRRMTETSCVKPEELQAVYHLLYPMTQVSEEVRQKHIADIEREHRGSEKAPSVSSPHPKKSQKSPKAEVSSAAPSISEKKFVGSESPKTERSASPKASPSGARKLPSPVSALAERSAISPRRTEQGVTASSESHEKCCPRCGSALVRRQAQKGKQAGNAFWGCSAFPNCRYTEYETT